MQDVAVPTGPHVSFTDTAQRSINSFVCWIALLAAISILAYLLSSFIFRFGHEMSELPLYLTLAIGGTSIIWRLARQVIHL